MKRITKIVAYYRVSTKRQGESGLGLEGQRAAVESYAKQNGAMIVGAYTEIESGRKNDRPVLRQATGHARLAKATLVVAKLDRLYRNVSFLAALMDDGGVDFVCCDNPHASRLTVHILAAVAEDEARRISERTVAALAALKRRGVKLGSARPGHWTGRESKRDPHKASQAAAVARHKAALDTYAFLMPTIRESRTNGQTLQQIADTLNANGHATRSGKPWTATAALRVWRMAETQG